MHSGAFFAEIARMLEAEPDLDSTLCKITSTAKTALACDHAGVTLLHTGSRMETVAATHELIEKADALQNETGQGPSLQADWSHGSFVVDDLATERRWPLWSPKAVGLGLRSMLAVQLTTSTRVHGALNLYASEPRRFDEDDIAIAHIYATHASIALAAERRETQLRQAMDARHVIGQAQGILMERFGIDADRAFEVLHRYSNDRNMKLRAVAQHIIDTHQLPSL